MENLNNAYEQNDPKNKKEKKEKAESHSSVIDNVDQYCKDIDDCCNDVDENLWVSPAAKSKISNMLKYTSGFAEGTDMTLKAYEDIKSAFTTKKGFIKFMLDFPVAPSSLYQTQEKSGIQKKAEDISQYMHLLGLDYGFTDTGEAIDACTDNEIDQCLE